MGLIKKIVTAVSDRAKEELKEYVKRVIEEKENITIKKSVVETPSVQEEIQPQAPSEQKQEIKDPEKMAIADIVPLVSDLPQKYSFTMSQPPLTRDVVDVAQQLPFDEFALYMKLYTYSVSQRKNYGYLGNSLRKKTGLDTMEHRKFEMTLLKLSARGLISIEDLSSNQRTFILYIPFDEEYLKSQKKHEAPKAEQPQNNRNRQNHNPPRKQGGSNRPNNKQKSKPSTSPSHQKKNTPSTKKPVVVAQKETDKSKMESKQYNTFVSLEIDKAKMRVGRSSFDKIYMEAVKYIDSTYGFKVLSDTEKFKEHLTNYYMSAFDIPGFEEWQKNKK